ncbi:MAG: formyl transferase domain protein [Conexibacter sp.]|nr:formyl transferase domain protein [Conexibacter sp.]
MTARSRSVLLLGKGDLAIRIAGWFREHPDWDLAGIVPVIPEPTWTASLSDWAAEHAIPIVESGHFRDVDGSQPIDLAFSCFYDRIIDAAFIARCGRILNLHNGPLPRYRGVSPINWALKNGESAHGVTIHEITPGIDDGPIVSQATYSIHPDVDEVRDVYARALEFGWTLFAETLPLLDRIVPRGQDERLATYYSAGENHLLGDRASFTRADSAQPRTLEAVRAS